MNLYIQIMQRNPEKNGSQPLSDMLNSPGAELEFISNSTFGFVFRLTVNSRYSEYLHSDALGLCTGTPKPSQYNKYAIDKSVPEIDTDTIMTPITNYIIKLVVLKEKVDNYMYQRTEKRTVTPNEFLQEANVQKNIWDISKRGAKLPVCPSVANIWQFDLENSRRFMQVLNTNFIHWNFWLSETQLKTHDVINFLKIMIDHFDWYQIGVMVMTEIPNSCTLTEFTYVDYLDTIIITQVYLKSITVLIRLIIESGIIHTDFRPDNILVYECNGGFEVIAIDFGKINTILINQGVNKWLKSFRENYYTLAYIGARTRSGNQTVNVERLNYFFEDFKINALPIILGGIDNTDWIIDLLIPKNYMDIFSYLKTSLTANIDAGDFVDFSTTLQHTGLNTGKVYYQACNKNVCTVMGGKLNKRKTNRKKINRKSFYPPRFLHKTRGEQTRLKRISRRRSVDMVGGKPRQIRARRPRSPRRPKARSRIHDIYGTP